METLEQKVQAALINDKRTKEAAIEVLNNNGVISLGGIVADNRISDAAESIVRGVNGVTSVVNEIQVAAADDDSSFYV